MLNWHNSLAILLVVLTLGCGQHHLITAVHSLLPLLHLQLAGCRVKEAAEGCRF